MLADSNILDDDDDVQETDSMDYSMLSSCTSHLNASTFSNIDGATALPTSFSNISQLLTEKIQIVNPVVEDDDGRRKTYEAEDSHQLNDNAWGDHLKKRIPKKVETEKPKSPLKLFDKLKDKLLPRFNFKLRNPHKSFTKSKSHASQHSSGEGGTAKEQFPDFETVLRQKSQKEAPPVLKTVTEEIGDHAAAQPLQLNQQWLDRVSADCVEGPATAQFIPVDKTTSFGLSKLALTDRNQPPPRDVARPTNDDSDHSVISNSEDESTSFHTQILKRRRISHVEERVTKSTIPEAAPLTATTSTTITAADEEELNTSEDRRRSARATKASYSEFMDAESEAEPFAASSDEDANFVPSSDEDEKPKKARSGTRKAKEKKTTQNTVKEPKKEKEKKSPRTSSTGKRKSNSKKSTTADDGKPVEDPSTVAEEPTEQQQQEYLPPIDVLTDVVPRLATKELKRTSAKFYDYLVQETPSTAGGGGVKSQDPNDDKTAVVVPISLAERKANEAKERLLKKISSGGLNDNFVRVDLKKKIFVKGVKTGQFRREKMKNWRHKKRVGAMSGPDMNMGGCDGGLLTCFQCGGIGHFAQNCKVRVDSLLQVDVADDSPFLTLDEAEKMAEERRLHAHSQRPDVLPGAASGGYKVGQGDEDSEVGDTDEEEELEDGIGAGGGDNDEDKENATGEEEEVETEDDRWAAVNDGDLLKAPEYIGHRIPEELLAKSGIMSQGQTIEENRVKPMYSLNADGTIPETPAEVVTALKQFGHTGFRFGQEQAVMRILCGQSTLVTLATGSGKSLCYQLPAYLYRQHTNKRCITLVVSPLVSLMEDQVTGVPGFLNAQCLHTNQTEKMRRTVLEQLKLGLVDVLLLSPEAIVAGEKSTGFGQILKELPPIAFVCIDEAHCVSQWSHNFRPSYLMICRVLREKLGIDIVLGLTATATAQTRASIVRQLAVPDGVRGIISDTPLPDNLILTVSKDKQRDRALIDLLRSERFASCASIIIYCTRRDDCERIAGLLRTSLQSFEAKPVAEEEGNPTNGKKRKRGRAGGDAIAEAYHAGLAAGRRRTIQNSFMRGDLRIVCATIAFGMGINKSDIRAIIHYNMPKSYESYVQEVGRAGRDGEIAHCHLFLDGADKTELRRHIYGNSIDRHVIRKLLQKVFVPCVCGAMRSCPGHEVAFPVDSTVQLLDIPEENISTLLCYLELDTTNKIQVLSKGYTMCKVLSYGGPGQLKQAAKNCAPLAMAIALDLKRGVKHDTSTSIEFPVIDIASSIGWDSGVVKYQLKKLEWTEQAGQKSLRSKITVSYFDLGFRIRAPGNLMDDQLDATLEYLYDRVTRQEKTEIIQLHNVFSGLFAVAHDTYHAVKRKELDMERTECLKGTIRSYFQNESFESEEYDRIVADERQTMTAGQMDHVSSDIYTLISRYPENNFTGRAIARIFHGIGSPNYPPVIWGRCKFWRVHLATDFNAIIQCANAIIIRLRTNT